MGNELAKRYAIEPEATGSGGHGYSWKSYNATRKKDGLEVSVFVFDKGALEKKLRGQGKDLVRQIVEVMRRDVEVMCEYCGVDARALERARAPAGGASLRESMMSSVSGGAPVATATKRAPLGCLQLIETLESRTGVVFVGERVACSLGNAVHNLWPNVEAGQVPRECLKYGAGLGTPMAHAMTGQIWDRNIMVPYGPTWASYETLWQLLVIA